MGIICLLCKKGDRQDLKNWRPITLLNADYKILAKAMANHLVAVFPFLVNVDQTCCVSDRSIQDNIRLLQDTVDLCETTDSMAALVSLDQEKAFDWVNWQLLEQVMMEMNIEQSFVWWVMTLYNDI